jgi:hypothetical protein
MGALMGLNRYKSYKQLIIDKKYPELVKEIDNAACNWGKLFEPIIGRYIELLYGTRVRGSNICIQEIDTHRNSPDGYCLINTADDECEISPEDAPKLLSPDGWTLDKIIDTLLFLLEFKCPLTRIPDGRVPTHYEPQVWSGLAVSSVADKGLFVDALFRKCSLGELGWNGQYDIEYHKSEIMDEPIAVGIIGVFAEIALNGTFVDFGLIGKLGFEETIRRISKKKLSIINTDPILSKEMDLEAEIEQRLVSLSDYQDEKKQLIGVIPWKLFDVQSVIVERKKGFEAEIVKMLDKFWKDVENYGKDHETTDHASDDDVSDII